MRTSVPDRNWRKLQMALRDNKEPTDTWLKKVYRVMIGEEDDDIISEALRILKEPIGREAVFAFFACRAYEHEIVKHLEIGEEEVKVIQRLIFDPEEIYNKLDHLAYVEKFIANQVETVDGENMIRLAMVSGPHALKERLRIGHEEIPLDIRSMTRQMMMTAFSLGTVVRGNEITAEASQQSLKWFGAMTKTLKTYDDLNLADEAEQTAYDAINAKVRIDEKRETVTLEQAGLLPSEIMH